MAPPHSATTVKPMSKEDHEQRSPSVDTLLVITVPATQTSLELSDYTGSFLTQALHMFSPVRNTLPQHFKGPSWIPIPAEMPIPQSGLLWLPYLSVTGPPRRPALAPLASLYPVSFLHIPAKFLMMRLQCWILFKLSFRIIGIVYLSPGEQKLHESRVGGIFSLRWEPSPVPGTQWISSQILGRTKPDTEVRLKRIQNSMAPFVWNLFHFWGDL